MEAGTPEQGGQRRAGSRSRGERGAWAGTSGRRSGAKKRRRGGDEPASAAINGNSGEVASYYLGNQHHLINRHTESVAINGDQTARWTLKIDFELPEAEEARCDEHAGEAMFLFPLLFLRKAQGRTGFEARDEHGATVPLLNRKLSDEISGQAAAKAAARLVDEARADSPDLPDLPEKSLQFVFERICKWRPYIALVILNKLKKDLDDGILAAWKKERLTDDLELLVDHSLVWVPLRGLPGERRVIEVAHDTELSRRPLLRWHFGELKVPENRLRWWRRRRRKKQMKDKTQVLATGYATYGRTARRASLSVLGERLAQPLGWMPISFDFPTIYTRRCDSYHFEMTCPGGLKPRGVRVALDEEANGTQEEEGQGAAGKDKKSDDEEMVLEERRQRLKDSGRKTMGSRAAHMYLPGGRSVGDVVLRATVGISNDAFPILWVLMGSITTVMLWSLVAFNPSWLADGDDQSRNEIAAGVLLVVPALLGALIIGSDEKAESKLLSGARLLLLVTGLCSAGAAAVLTDIDPISNKPQATWAVCATIATAAMIPLVTSWLLSLDVVWRGREALSTVTSQYIALVLLGGLGAALFLLLPEAGGETAFRAGLACCLLLLSVLLALLASNRLPVALEANRKFVSVGAMLAAVICLILGCIQLQRIFAPDAGWQSQVEEAELWILVFAPLSGLALWVVSLIFGPRREELSISPAAGRELLRWERIRELRRLREIGKHPNSDWSRTFGEVRSWRPTSDDDKEEQENRAQGNVKVEPAGRSEGNWSAAALSSTKLPEPKEKEFSYVVEHGAEGGEARIGEVAQEDRGDEEIEATAERAGKTPLAIELEKLNYHVDELLEAGGKESLKDRLKRGVSKLRGRG